MAAKPSIASNRIQLGFSLGLLLVFWTSRLIAIDHFPMFTDEAFHVRFARNVIEKGPLSNAEEGRQLTIWLYTAVQADRHAAIFTARTATLLAALPGLAALMASAHLLAGIWGAVFVGLLIQFSPYHMFFERMALADPVSASLLSVALYFTLRLVRRTSLWDALWVGILLFAAFGAKVSSLPFVAMPVAGVLFLRSRARSWRESLRWAAVALGAAGILIALFAALLLWQGHNPFFYLVRGTNQTASTTGLIGLLLDRIPNNIASTFINLSGFVGLPGILLLFTALIVLIWRRRWFLPALVLGSVLVFWLNNRPDTRHLIIPLNIALLAGAVVLAALVRNRPPVIQVGALAALLLIGLFNWLPFTLALNANPAALNIPWNDYHQYIASEGSGSGLDEVAAVLTAENTRQVIGIFANCWALEYMVEDKLPVTCPHLNPTGADIDALTQLLQDSQRAGVYVVLEEIAYAPADVPGKLVTTIERPANGPRLHIYDLTPDTS